MAKKTPKAPPPKGKPGSEKSAKQKRASLGSRVQTKGSLPSMRYC